MTDCVVLIPCLRRPHRVAPLLQSLRATSDARPLFICTPGDYDQRAAIMAADADWIDTERPYTRGDYARKSNLGIKETSEPLIFLAADDLRFHPGWYEAARRKLTPGIGVVGTNDRGNARVKRGWHATHSLVTREYVEQFGTVDEPGKALHEGYHHNFCDTELVQTAMARGAWKFAADSVVEHLHPNWGKAPRDDVYDHGQSEFDLDRQIYERRMPKWTSPSS